MVKASWPKEDKDIKAKHMWIVIVGCVVLFIGFTGWLDLINWEKMWESGPPIEEQLGAEKMNTNEFMLEFKDYDLSMQICDHQVRMGQSDDTKDSLFDERCVVELEIGKYKNKVQHAVYVREEEQPYSLCEGLYVIYNSDCECSGNKGDYYMFYVTDKFRRYLVDFNPKEVVKGIKESLDVVTPEEGENTKLLMKVKGETIDVDIDKLTGAKKERYLYAKFLEGEAGGFRIDVPTWNKATHEDSKGRKLKKIGSIWMTPEEENREYEFYYDEGILEDHFGHINSDVYDNLLEKLGKNAAAKIVESQEEVKQQKQIEEEGDWTMFGFTWWQIFGIIVIFVIVDRISYKLIRKSIIVFAKTIFVKVMQHVGLWKKDWEDIKVGEEKQEV